MLRADEDVMVLRATLAHARGALSIASSLSNDDRLRGPATTAAALLDRTLADEAASLPDSEKLTVALLGRTKAGKSQLVAALTGDPEGGEIGVGRQRTTRMEHVVHLPQFDLVDLPGVAALDGDVDTELALSMAQRADAVLWVYTESLLEEEACELEDLMRKGKPVVVGFNVKQSIGDERLRKVFIRYPNRTFRDLASHEERVAQIAKRAGTQVPPFVAFHARAAWWAKCHDDPRLAAASRIRDLTAACEEVLVDKASVLRIRSQYDHPRRKLVAFGAAAELAASELVQDERRLERLVERECDAILIRVANLVSDSLAQLDAAAGRARQGLDGWLVKHSWDQGNKLNSAWQDYIDGARVYQVLDEYEDRLQQRLTSERIAMAAHGLRDGQQALTRRLEPDPGRGAWGVIKSGLRVVGRGVAAACRTVGLDRGIAILAKWLIGRAMPGVGWWLVLVDGLRALSQGVREELAARRMSTAAWSSDQRMACLSFISDTESVIRVFLEKSEEIVKDTLEKHRMAVQGALGQSGVARVSLVQACKTADEAVAACDRDLISRLLDKDGINLRVCEVRRIPNCSVEVAFQGPDDYKVAVEALMDHLAPEEVSLIGSRLVPDLVRHIPKKVGV